MSRLIPVPTRLYNGLLINFDMELNLTVGNLRELPNLILSTNHVKQWLQQWDTK